MQFDNSFVNCSISFENNYNIVKISGNIKNPGMFQKMLIFAANPIDRMSNYSGSGLPFPCADIAFDNTPNKYLIESSGFFKVTFKYPNSYYSQNGFTKIISAIFFILDTGNKKENFKIELKDLCVLRTLTDRQSKKKGPEYYAAKDYLLPIDTTENVMRAYNTTKEKLEKA